jgi:hypothetical protein
LGSINSRAVVILPQDHVETGLVRHGGNQPFRLFTTSNLLIACSELRFIAGCYVVPFLVITPSWALVEHKALHARLKALPIGRVLSMFHTADAVKERLSATLDSTNPLLGPCSYLVNLCLEVGWGTVHEVRSVDNIGSLVVHHHLLHLLPLKSSP